MDALEQLLDRESWSGITVRHVAAAAGVAEATYYRHFQSRSDLLNACAQRSLQTFEERLEMLRAIAPTHAEERERLRALIVEFVKNPPGAAVMYALWTTGESRGLRVERQATRARALSSYLRELRDRGYVTYLDSEIEELSAQLALLLQSFSYRSVIERRHLDEGEYEAVAAIVDRLIFR